MRKTVLDLGSTSYPDVVEEWYDEDNIDIEPIDKLKSDEVTKVILKDGDGYKVKPYLKKHYEFSDAEIEGMIVSAN